MLRRPDVERGYWFRLRRSASPKLTVNGFVIVPNGARGWTAFLAYLATTIWLPVLIRLHGPFGWALVGGEMLLLLSFACVVLATCDPYEPSRRGD